MKLIKRRLLCLLMAILLLSGTGCEKFLAEKPDKKLVIPEKIGDFQALLDNYNLTNYNGSTAAGEVSTDDYYLTDPDWSALSQESFRRMYTWEKDFVFALDRTNDWNTCYVSVHHANTVIKGIEQIKRDKNNDAEWKSLKGQALVLRANTFLDAVIVWSLAYDESTAGNDLGIPLRLNPDFNVVSTRASVRESYNQIINDLKEAATLLPHTQVSLLRANKTAAYGLLARAYLAMRKYKEAGAYADSCLSLNNKLLDYNSLNPSKTYPIPNMNVEVIIERGFSSTPTGNTRAKINPALYSLYTSTDLRKSLYFKNNNDGSFAFRGSYLGAGSQHNGVITDEIYLTRAECFARENKLSEALEDLNTLLRKRWKTGTYIEKSILNTPDVLHEILTERRKELLMRGLRWMDIKRLNKEGGNITLTRTVNGKTFTLVPNDKRFALNIPEDVIAISGMPQNPR